MILPEITRRATRQVCVGGLAIGSDYPVSVQSMTNTATHNIDATCRQINALADAGADFVRLAVPTKADTAALKEIIPRSPVPIIADVHFHFDRALEAIDAGVAKIRLNPGNISDHAQVRKVISAATDADVAIRIGVNEGSVVERRDTEKRSKELSTNICELMADKMAEYIDVFAAENFHNIVLSAKSRDAFTCVSVNRILAERWGYPIHLGLTHAGTVQTGAIRSAAAMATLLCEGIGDTIRISYSGDPLPEVRDAVELLQSLRLRERRGIELIACPTCGRLETDIREIVQQVQDELSDIRQHVIVAVMGCVVNGPGEADSADVAVCMSKKNAIIYKHGKKIETVPHEKIVETIAQHARDIARANSIRKRNTQHENSEEREIVEKKLNDILAGNYVVDFSDSDKRPCEPTKDEIQNAINNQQLERREFQGDITKLNDEWNLNNANKEIYRARIQQYHARRIAFFVAEGWTDPIELRENNSVKDGLHRFKAAQFLGKDTIRCKVVK